MRLLLLLFLLASPAAAVTLPIEVMGAVGTTKTVSVKVPTGGGAKAALLYLFIHNPSYEAKISVQVNASPWVILSNTSAHVYNPGRSYGGIGGAYGSLKMTVPVSGVTDGKNTIQFRFNGTDGVSSGFRVIGLNFLASDSVTPILPPSAFTWDNPANWKPPYSDAGSISEGKKLWESATLWQSPLIKTPTKVSCGNCHVPNGYDLKYFNYSNYAITKRAEFHGLKTKQGQQIASYIRTLHGPAPGRPWNPPYQPGPGIDAKPVTSWAAGAGIEWALGSDADVLPYLQFGAKLNMRQIPAAMQLPDWNHWLPRIHPLDAWGEAFTSSTFYTYRETVREGLTGAADLKEYAQTGKFAASLGQWYTRRQEFLKPRAEDWPADKWTPAHSESVYATALWHLVQTWGMMQEFGMEGYGPTGDERTWYGNGLFSVSPFMLKIPSTSNGLRGSPLINEYAASVWYHSQLVMNVDNQGKPSGQSPVDWSYTYGKLKDMYGVSGYAEPMRLSLIVGKGIQVWDNSTGLDAQTGWSPQNKADVSRLVHFSFLPMWEGTPADVSRSVMQTLLEKWFAVTDRYTKEQYYAVGYADPLYVPKPWYSGPLGDKVLYMLPEFDKFGVSKPLLDRVRNWGAVVWPLGPWKTGPTDPDN